MKNNNIKKAANRTKLFSAIGMFTISAAMLASSTFAWFTMNKTVEVTGMKLQATAEKGILINEMARPSEGTWSESAIAGQAAPIALRPASTSNFTDWWHANSRKTNLEAGIGSGTATAVDSDNTVQLASGEYYSSLANALTDVTSATADTNAERTVYYNDGIGANSDTLDEGEAYYIKYTYYIKSSANEALNVSAGNLQAAVKATKTAGAGSGTTHSSDALDSALRVGIKVTDDDKATIFAPVAGADANYKVTKDAAGSDSVAITPIVASTTGTATAATAINAANVSLPAVTANGIAVDVYVWFEGEDTNCKSDNLAEILDNYQIDITFTDAELN